MTTASRASVRGLNGASDEIVRPGIAIRQGAYAHAPQAIAAHTHAGGTSQRERRSRRSGVLSRRHATIAPVSANRATVAPGNSSPSGLPQRAVQPHNTTVEWAVKSDVTSALKLMISASLR